MQRLWEGTADGTRDELSRLRGEADEARAAALAAARRAAKARAVADGAIRALPEKYRITPNGEKSGT